jgi:hypothetical protein
MKLEATEYRANADDPAGLNAGQPPAIDYWSRS